MLVNACPHINFGQSGSLSVFGIAWGFPSTVDSPGPSLSSTDLGIEMMVSSEAKSSRGPYFLDCSGCSPPAASAAPRICQNCMVSGSQDPWTWPWISTGPRIGMCAHEGEALLRNHGFSHLGSRFQALYVNHVSMQLIQKVRHAFSVPPGLLVRSLFPKAQIMCWGLSDIRRSSQGGLVPKFKLVLMQDRPMKRWGVEARNTSRLTEEMAV